MTDYDNDPDPDERLLDRMVDGELDEHDQRALLARLDDAGWRKLALSYVESQAWRSEFGTLAQSPQPLESVSRTSLARERLSSTSLTALVVGFLLAIGLGYLFDFVPQRRDQVQPRVVIERDTPQPMIVPVSTSDPGRMRFVVDGGAGDGVLREIDVPLINASQVNDEWIETHVTTIPPHLRRALEKRGHQVIERRSWYPVELSDGREVLLPIDEVQLRFATTTSPQ